MVIDYSKEDKLRKEYASTEYTGVACEHCGRMRVLKCANGKKVCEKCYWNQDTHSHDRDYASVYP